MRRRPSTRAFWIAAVVVCGALMGVALFLALRTEQHVERNREAGNTVLHYGSLLVAIEGQEIATHEHVAGVGDPAESRADFVQATAVAEASLSRLGGDPSFSDSAALVPADYAHFHKAAVAAMASVDSGQREAAQLIDRRQVEPAFEQVIDEVAELTQVSADQANAATSKLESVSETMLLVLPIAFVLAGGILFFLMRAGRRATRAEAKARASVGLLERAALTDSLTGLRNHRAFEEDLAAMTAGAVRTNSGLCLVSIDMTGLKRINDTFGHQVGDRSLCKVAEALLRVIGPSGSAYRVGGDEFALLLPEAGVWSGYRAAERVRGELDSVGSDVDIAAGVAELRQGEGRVELVRSADIALINAKRTNRKVTIYSVELDASTDGRPIQRDEHHLQVLASALARAVDAKDSYTRSHSETVSNLCALIGTELGLDTERLGKLRVAGLLHDVGKIGTPDAILSKPSDLTTEEYEKLKEHPALGEEILTAADLRIEAEWIRHHHERPDGRGYPDGVQGERIPLESRIIGVADAFEAMISNRPYRTGRSELEALQELEHHARTQFDPECVAALRRGLRTGMTVSENGGARPIQRAASSFVAVNANPASSVSSDGDMPSRSSATAKRI